MLSTGFEELGNCYSVHVYQVVVAFEYNEDYSGSVGVTLLLEDWMVESRAEYLIPL